MTYDEYLEQRNKKKKKDKEEGVREVKQESSGLTLDEYLSAKAGIEPDKNKPTKADTQAQNARVSADSAQANTGRKQWNEPR